MHNDFAHLPALQCIAYGPITQDVEGFHRPDNIGEKMGGCATPFQELTSRGRTRAHLAIEHELGCILFIWIWEVRL